MTSLAITTSSRTSAYTPGAGRQPFGRGTEYLWNLDVVSVDDDEADSSLIVEALRRNPHVRAVTAFAAPSDALFQLVEGLVKPDLILLDIHMPKVNGFTFMRALREAPWMRTTPVVLLTTSGHKEDVDRARSNDILGYIVKPDSFAEMQQKINGVIRQMVVGE
ncbi:response regulator [Phenylobacterium sp.]|uniref:response regulator n=1 Tax=Phenylobacterium sp. TaxID=1871053 RepID=UPI0035B191FA